MDGEIRSNFGELTPSTSFTDIEHEIIDEMKARFRKTLKGFAIHDTGEVWNYNSKERREKVKDLLNRILTEEALSSKTLSTILAKMSITHMSENDIKSINNALDMYNVKLLKHGSNLMMRLEKPRPDEELSYYTIGFYRLTNADIHMKSAANSKQDTKYTSDLLAGKKQAVNVKNSMNNSSMDPNKAPLIDIPSIKLYNVLLVNIHGYNKNSVTISYQDASGRINRTNIPNVTSDQFSCLMALLRKYRNGQKKDIDVNSIPPFIDVKNT
jgi:hypothetical protein